MSFTSNDYEQLQQLINESPENQVLIQKLLDYQQYTISKISHELRNPLTFAYSTFQLIESQHPEVTSYKYWDSLRGDLEFMSQLLAELSTYNNSQRLHNRAFSSLDFLRKICLSFAASCVDTEIEFTSKIPDSLPTITGDELKLKEVLLNLLKNAKEAVGSQGAIHLLAEMNENHLIIHISDNGCGIPSEHLDTIFDAFITHKSGGTGLGLSIAKRVVEAHGGTISVSSVAGQGTTFLLKLPVT